MMLLLKPLMLLLLVFIFHFNGIAQVKVLKYKVGASNFRTNRIIVDSIVDVRPSASYIGYNYNSINQKIKPIKIDESFSTIIKKYMNGRFKEESYSEHLILRVNRFFIYNLESVYQCEINISFIINNDGRYYEKFQASATVNGTLNVIVNKALTACFKQYITRDKLNKISCSERFIEVDLNKNPLNELSYKMNEKKVFKRELYPTFFDFRDNTADTSTVFIIDYKKGGAEALIKSTASKYIDYYWGFNDGGNFYVKRGNKFVKVLNDSGNLFIYDNPPDYAANIGAVTFVGGLFMGIVYASTVDKIPYFLDLASGSFNHNKFKPDYSAKGKVVILSSKANKKDSRIELLLNDTIFCELKSRNYTTLTFDSQAESALIGIGSGKLKKIVELSPLPFNTQLYIVRAKNGKLFISEPPKAMRKEIITEFEDGKYYEVKEIGTAITDK